MMELCNLWPGKLKVPTLHIESAPKDCPDAIAWYRNGKIYSYCEWHLKDTRVLIHEFAHHVTREERLNPYGENSWQHGGDYLKVLKFLNAELLIQQKIINARRLCKALKVKSTLEILEGI